jgi:hypothetical protein
MERNQTAIRIPFPDAVERHLTLRVGACRLRLTRGSGLDWVDGTYNDPTGSLRSRIVQEGGSARITQEPQVTELLGWRRGVPAFDLALGTAHPFSLTIETGASDTDVELGGVPLKRLAMKLGAGKSTLRFLEPNPQSMSVLDVDAGAGSMELRGLANANFADMTLNGGAAAFVSEFGGSLQRDASAVISAGMSTVELVIPATTAARVVMESTLGRLDTSDGFTTREGGYWTQAAIADRKPVLTIRASVALGLLTLRTT